MREVIQIGGLELRFFESKDSTAGSLDLFEMTVQPQGRVPAPHYHESWDETVYGLSGVLTFRVGGDERRLGPGETLFIPRGMVHGFRNDGAGPGTCLVVLTPGVLGPAYFREIAALVNGGAPDPADVKATMLRHGLVPASDA